MITLFEKRNKKIRQKENFPLFFYLVRMLKERIDQNAKKKSMRDSRTREREGERETMTRSEKKDARDTTQNKSLPLFMYMYLNHGRS